MMCDCSVVVVVSVCDDDDEDGLRCDGFST